MDMDVFDRPYPLSQQNGKADKFRPYGDDNDKFQDKAS